MYAACMYYLLMSFPSVTHSKVVSPSFYKYHPQLFPWSHPVIRFSMKVQFANIVIVYNAFCSNNYIERRTFRTSIVITAGIKPGRSYSCFVRALTHISTTSTTTVSVVTDDISK